MWELVGAGEREKERENLKIRTGNLQKLKSIYPSHFYKNPKKKKSQKSKQTNLIIKNRQKNRRRGRRTEKPGLKEGREKGRKK